jgi:hypothetical protein
MSQVTGNALISLNDYSGGAMSITKLDVLAGYFRFCHDLCHRICIRNNLICVTKSSLGSC